jgi:hypothetical protein
MMPAGEYLVGEFGRIESDSPEGLSLSSAQDIEDGKLSVREKLRRNPLCLAVNWHFRLLQLTCSRGEHQITFRIVAPTHTLDQRGHQPA